MSCYFTHSEGGKRRIYTFFKSFSTYVNVMKSTGIRVRLSNFLYASTTGAVRKNESKTTIRQNLTKTNGTSRQTNHSNIVTKMFSQCLSITVHSIVPLIPARRNIFFGKNTTLQERLPRVCFPNHYNLNYFKSRSHFYLDATQPYNLHSLIRVTSHNNLMHQLSTLNGS